MMSEIPRDLLKEILIRSTFEDLIRFRSVSSSFRDIIDSPPFRKEHSSRSPSPSGPPHTLILCSKSTSYKLIFQTITPSTNPTLHASVQKINNPITPRHPFSCDKYSANGLLLLRDGIHHQLHLWDPYTNGARNLALGNLLDVPYFFAVNYGIGFGERSRGLKVVLIRHCCSYAVTFSRLHSRSDAFVFDLGTNSGWKPMGKLDFCISDKKSFGVFLSGALHWAVNTFDPYNKSLLAIDLETEKCRIVELPRTGDHDFEMELCVLGGCLCASWWSHRTEKFDVWSMKEYGVVESWSKVCVLSPNDPGAPLFFGVKPVLYSNCGTQVLLALDTGLVWYHLRNKSYKLIKLLGWGNIKHFTTTAYAGSFVPMDCDTLELQIPPPTMRRKRKLQIKNL